MQEVLRFNYDNINYVIVRVNDVLRFGKIVNENLVFDITQKERQLINDVFKEILPSNNMVTLGVLRLNNKDFIHFLDKRNWLNVFYEIINNSLVCPSKEDLIFFNNTFNHQSEYVYVGMIEKNKDFFRRIVKKGEKLITVLIASSTLLISSVLADVVNINQADVVTISANTFMDVGTGEESLASLFDNLDSYIEMVQPIEEVDSKDLSEEKIIEAIKNNSNLSDKEKQLFLSCPEFFQERLGYLDYDTVINSLNKLRVVYVNDNGYLGNKNVSGTFRRVTKDWNIEDAIITIHNASSFDDAKRDVLTHEFCHVFEKTEVASFGNSIFEFLNMKINNEYWGKEQGDNGFYDMGYGNLYKNGCALCEIIDNLEVLNQYHANPNPKYLIDELVKIIPNEELAVQVISCFDKINDLSSSPEFIDQLNYCNAQLKKLLTDYYEAKTHSKIIDNELMLYYLDTDKFMENINKKYNLPQGASFAPVVIKDKKYLKINDSLDNSFVVQVVDKVEETYEFYTEEEMQFIIAEAGMDFGNRAEKMTDGTFRVKYYQGVSSVDYALEAFNNNLSR